MAVEVQNQEKLDEILDKDPKVVVYLEPIAAPVVLGLAGFAGSTWVVSMYLARWWGDEHSPAEWFPFTAFWGGLGQFIAGFFAFHARDLLGTIVHVLWGSFWLSSGLLFLLEAWGTLPTRSMDHHFPELASWFVVLTFFTFATTVSIATRDVIYAAVLFFLACGAAIACCEYAWGEGVVRGMKAAAYFWLVSAALAWLRVTLALFEEGFGDKAPWFFRSSKVPIERRKTYLHIGTGEYGVKRAKAGVI